MTKQEYWDSLNQLDKYKYIKQIAGNLVKSYIAYEKSSDTAFNNGELINRTGIRGGRYTTNQARLETYLDSYNQDITLLKEMVNKLN